MALLTALGALGHKEVKGFSMLLICGHWFYNILRCEDDWDLGCRLDQRTCSLGSHSQGSHDRR